MPWKQTDPKAVRRPCCGATAPVTALFIGSVRLSHALTCRFRR
jgi:hypothetical protein